MVSEQIRNWALRFVIANDTDSVQKHIKLLAESGNSQTLLAAIEQAVAIQNLASLSGPYFGHTEIAKDKLPLVNKAGFFLRGHNGWKWVPADYESVIQLVINDVNFQVVAIDHVDNFFYSVGKPLLVPNRPVLEIARGVSQEEGQYIWHVKNGQGKGWTIPSAGRSYIDYWDGVAGVEAVIREDFILNESDIKELVKAFLDEEPFSNRFELVETFFGFHPDMAKEYLGENS